MALPFEIFIVLIGTALGSIAISTLGDDTSGKTMMFIAGAIIIMLTGMFILTDGIEIGVYGYDTTSAVVQIVRNTYDTSTMSIYLLANMLFWGGFALVGFGTYNIYKSKQAANQEDWI